VPVSLVASGRQSLCACLRLRARARIGPDRTRSVRSVLGDHLSGVRELVTGLVPDGGSCSFSMAGRRCAARSQTSAATRPAVALACRRSSNSLVGGAAFT
jgi:hypothetical protein